MSGIQSAVALVSARFQHEVERIEAQLGWARELCLLHPDKAGTWQPLIQQAAAQVQAAAETGDYTVMRDAVKMAEQCLGPLGQLAKSYTIHAVGHGHIDMNWMWSWPETVAVTVDTVSTVLRLMEEYPGFCYSQSQCSIYEILEKHRPDLLKRVACRVKEGRWEVTASHWVEGDKNLAGPESLCRHVLYSRRYMQKLFRLTPEDVPIDWAPDTFGHPATVPTYLSRAGIRYLYMYRPGTLLTPKPWLFWWEGPDGSRVLIRNESNSRHAYSGSICPGWIQDLLAYTRETGLKDFMFVYGVGDHGGGPTRRDLERAMDMNTWPIFPSVRFSTTRFWFDLVSVKGAKLPVHRGELNFEFTGCYTTQTLIKKANRYGENRLVVAETASALVSAAGLGTYPSAAFEEGWRHILFNHFHDILPGSGVMETRTYSHGIYQQTMAITAQAEGAALQALAASLDTSGLAGGEQLKTPASRLRSGLGAGVGLGTADGGLSRAERSAGHGSRPIVLFNPGAGDRHEVVDAHVWDNGPAGTTPMRNRRYRVQGPDGTVAPAQVTGGGGYWGHDYATVAFPVSVAGLGYAVYTVIEEVSGAADNAGPVDQPVVLNGPVHHCGYSMVERGAEGLENEFLRVEIDPATGGVRRLLDKVAGVDLIQPMPSAPVLEYEVERPHGMTAWLIQHPGTPPEYPRLKALRRGLNGPYRATLEADLAIYESEFTVTYEIRRGDPKLYIRIAGTWFQRGTPQTGVPALSFVLPLALKDARGRYEIPFGALDRDLNQREEVPALQWAQVTGTAGDAQAGCLLLNDCKYGHSLQGSTLRLTLIRGSYDPDILPEIGQHEIHLAIRPFRGDLPVESAIADGQAFNQALRVMGTDVHEGNRPLSGRFLRLTPSTAVLCGVKQAEDGRRLVVRVFNPIGERVIAKLDFSGGGLMPEPESAVELDLLEREVEKGTANVNGRVVTVIVPPHGIATVGVGWKRKG